MAEGEVGGHFDSGDTKSGTDSWGKSGGSVLHKNFASLKVQIFFQPPPPVAISTTRHRRFKRPTAEMNDDRAVPMDE